MANGYSGINRRSFLKGSAIASATIAAEPVAERGYGILRGIYGLVHDFFANPRGGRDNLAQNQESLENRLGSAHAQERNGGSALPNPDYIKLNNEGIALMVKDDYANAATKFRESIRLNPNYADAYGNLASTFRHTRQFKEAIKMYEIALSKATNEDIIRGNYKGLALTYKEIGDKTKALEFMKQYEELTKKLGKMTTKIVEDIEKFRKSL